VDEGDRRGVDRLTIQEAARQLGISEGAVRKRVTRSTLEHHKDEDGRVYVYLDAGVDSRVDAGVDPNSIALISQLRDEVAYLRDENRRKDEIIMQQAMTMRQLSAAPSQEPSEDVETVEETSDRAESHSATGGAQEGTELPQQRSGWLAPLDKLPWWHYVLGLFLVNLATFVSFFAVQMMSTFGPTVLGVPIGAMVANVVLVWFPPGALGFWVGLRRRNPRFKSQVIPLGLLVGLAVSLGRVGQLVAVGTAYWGGGSDMYYWSAFIVAPALTGWLFYVSGVLVGNAWQRRRTGRLSGTTPASTMPGVNLASTGSRTPFTPRQQAILGFAGTVIAALISLMGTIASAILASGG
jgi:hypothetical protein